MKLLSAIIALIYFEIKSKVRNKNLDFRQSLKIDILLNCFHVWLWSAIIFHTSLSIFNGKTPTIIILYWTCNLIIFCGFKINDWLKKVGQIGENQLSHLPSKQKKKLCLMNQIQMHQGQIVEIIDSVYYEKLGLILSKLTEWEAKKSAQVEQFYNSTFLKWSRQAELNGMQLINESTELLKVLNLKYSFFSKVRKQEKEADISPAISQFFSYASQIQQVKSKILDLSQFICKTMGVVSYEISQAKRLYSDIDEIKKKANCFRIKINAQMSQKRQLICSKKSKKHFELQKIKNLVQGLSEERVFHDRMSRRMKQLSIAQAQMRNRFYKNCSDNLNYIHTLDLALFGSGGAAKLKQFYQKRLEQAIVDLNELMNVVPSDVSLDFFVELEKQFEDMFDIFLSQISIAKWKVNYANQQEVKQREAKQSKQPMTSSADLHLTLDQRLVLIEDKNILAEMNIEETKIGAPSSIGFIKLRTSKQRFQIRFNTVEKQDQFYLHLNRLVQNTYP